MIETIKSIKNKIEWFEKEEQSLTKAEKEAITRKLKEVNNALQRYMLLRMAINKQ